MITWTPLWIWDKNRGSVHVPSSHRWQSHVFLKLSLGSVIMRQIPGISIPWLVVWNMNFIFPYIGNLIIPIDELIFFRGVETTNQIQLGYVGMIWTPIRSCMGLKTYDIHYVDVHYVHCWLKTYDVMENLGQLIHLQRILLWSVMLPGSQSVPFINRLGCYFTMVYHINPH